MASSGRFAGLLVLAACSSTAPPVVVDVVTLNVEGGDTITDPVRGQAIADQLAALHPGVALVQECVSCGALHDRMPAGYGLVDAPDSELGILYRAADWTLADTGTIVLGDGDDGWGLREARWAELSATEGGGTLYVNSTRFCVPIRATDDPCDTDRQLVYAGAVLDDIAARDAPVILGGDFNVFDGFERGPVIGLLRDRGLVPTLDGSAATFGGNTWAPAGRLDYLFANSPVHVLAAWVQRTSASDHRPVSAIVASPPR